jgi:hypothetical protein
LAEMDAEGVLHFVGRANLTVKVVPAA